MKKTLTILSVALVALMLSSCVEKSKKYQQLLAEKDAVVLENQNIEKEYNAARSPYGELQEVHSR